MRTPTLCRWSVLPLVLTLSACGASVSVSVGGKTLKTGQIESTIMKDFASQGVTLHDVSCRDGVKAKVGASISCTALNALDTTLVMAGKVTMVAGSEGNYSVNVVGAHAPGTKIAALAQAALEKQVGARAKGMVCPDPVPIPTSPSVQCRLTDMQGVVFKVTVTVDKDEKIDATVEGRA